MYLRIEKALGANRTVEIRRIEVLRLLGERETHPVHSAVPEFAEIVRRMSYGPGELF
jgi:hypothetical protein